jgi:hypothetical protein
MSYIERQKMQEGVERNRAFLAAQPASWRELNDGPEVTNIS